MPIMWKIWAQSLAVITDINFQGYNPPSNLTSINKTLQNNPKQAMLDFPSTMNNEAWFFYAGQQITCLKILLHSQMFSHTRGVIKWLLGVVSNYQFSILVQSSSTLLPKHFNYEESFMFLILQPIWSVSKFCHDNYTFFF